MLPIAEYLCRSTVASYFRESRGLGWQSWNRIQQNTTMSTKPICEKAKSKENTRFLCCSRSKIQRSSRPYRVSRPFHSDGSLSANGWLASIADNIENSFSSPQCSLIPNPLHLASSCSSQSCTKSSRNLLGIRNTFLVFLIRGQMTCLLEYCSLVLPESSLQNFRLTDSSDLPSEDSIYSEIFSATDWFSLLSNRNLQTRSYSEQFEGSRLSPERSWLWSFWGVQMFRLGWIVSLRGWCVP